MLISLIFLSDDVLSVMSFFFYEGELYKYVISRTPISTREIAVFTRRIV